MLCLQNNNREILSGIREGANIVSLGTAPLWIIHIKPQESLLTSSILRTYELNLLVLDVDSKTQSEFVITHNCDPTSSIEKDKEAEDRALFCWFKNGEEVTKNEPFNLDAKLQIRRQ